MHRLLTAVTLALLGLILATPALAQEGTEQFSNQETQDLTQQLEQQQAEYDRLENKMLRIENQSDGLDYTDDPEYEAADDRLYTLDDQIPRTQADLVDARLGAIQDAPVNGSPEEQIQTYEEKIDALEALSDYNDREVSGTDTFATSSEIDDAIYAAEDGLERAEADQAEAQQSESAPPPDSGDSGDGGSSSSDSSGGPMAALGSIASAIVGFFVSLFVIWPATLAIMGAFTYRRTGSATEAAKTAMKPGRIALAFIIALVISLLGGLGAIWALLQAALILLAVPFIILLIVLRSKEGSFGAALARIGSWIGLLRGSTKSDGTDEGGGGQRDGDVPPGSGPIIGGDGQAHNTEGGQDSRPALQKYVNRDLTQEARDGILDEAVGRQDEIDSVVEILNRRKANNAAITGPAGVGKTVLVEELARKIVSGRVPPQLAGKEILELDINSISSGATLVGMFEERLQAVIDEVRAEPDRYILFVDEMHALMGAGTHGNDPSGAGDQLKPFLARGELRMIGATTLDEYREIEKDPAMARRFGRVDMPPLSVEQTIELLPTTARANEEHFDLTIEQDALAAAARLTDRHITDQALPGAATNLLETVCSSVALRGGETVTADDVARIVTRQTGVPVGSASDDERQQVLNLEESLRERMVGQDEAVTAVADAIKRKRSGFGAGRPASFGFFGVTGVGKTELAKALAEVLFGDENAMVRLDMSEYTTSTAGGGGSKWKLLGSDKGYMGSEEGGQLTEPVRRRPYSVVLLDEIEKANSEVLDPLLSILDDGHVTDGRGRKIDFSNTIVIMTSNHAAEVVADRWNRGLELTEEELAEALVQRQMRPELLQRLTKIAVFNPLKPDEVREIARIMLSKTAMTTAEEHGITVSFDDPVVAAIAQRGYDPKNGLRPLRRVIERQIEGPIADYTLKNGENKADITFVIKDGEIRARKTRESEQ